MSRKITRRQMIATAAVATVTAPAVAAGKLTDEEVNDTIDRHIRAKPAIPAGDEPELYNCTVALIDFIDHAEEYLVKHAIRNSVCSCGNCEDLRGQLYTVGMFQDTLEGVTLGGSMIWKRNDLLKQHREQREAAINASMDTATNITDKQLLAMLPSARPGWTA